MLLALPGLLPSSISEVNGAKIWIRLGGFSIQPGEFAKILLIVFFAAFLVQKRDAVHAGRPHGSSAWSSRAPATSAPLLVAWGLSSASWCSRATSARSLLFFGIVLVLLYIATERVSWLVIGLADLRRRRASSPTSCSATCARGCEIWLDPFADFNGSGYQLVQALFGLGTGGICGTGLGAGRPDLVPYAESDFMLSSLGEELGLFGLAAILVVYLVLITRGLRTRAGRARQLRQAAGHRPGVHAGAADVRRRRRRHRS